MDRLDFAERKYSKANLPGTGIFRTMELSEAAQAATAANPKIRAKSKLPIDIILASWASRWTLKAATVARKEILFLPRILEFSSP